MKIKTIIATLLTATLLTGCAGTATTESEQTSATTTSAATEHAHPIEDETDAPYVGDAHEWDVGDPVWTNNTNTHDNLTFGENKGGNFRVTRSFGDFGYEEYDVQYDNTTGYKSTYVYIYTTYGQSVAQYKQATDLGIGLKYIQNVQDNLYVANIEDNKLPGFDPSLSQDEAYTAVMSALGISYEPVEGESDYSPTEPVTDYITMKESYIKVPLGGAALLEHNHIPEGYTNLVFEIDDPLIAEIAYDGSIIGVKQGTTYVHISTPDYNYATTVIIEVV